MSAMENSFCPRARIKRMMFMMVVRVLSWTSWLLLLDYWLFLSIVPERMAKTIILCDNLLAVLLYEK